MSTRRSAFVARLLLVATCASLVPVGALAAPKKVAQESEATKLKKLGDQAMLDLRYEDALKAWDESWALEPNPALQYNRGRALEALGRHAEALDAYERFLKDAPADLRAKVPQLEGHVKEVRARVTILTLNVTPKGARVVLRNVVLGNAPFAEALRVNAGKASIEVSAEGYQPWVKEVDLPGGSALTLDVTLTAKSTGGTLIVKSDPAATVSVDGKPLGTTPVEVSVAAGSHSVALVRDGWVGRTSTVVVGEGERKDVSFGLERESGIASKWWFWTGVGVVVVGATALTIGLMTEREAGRGDIAPGRVSAPLVSF